MIFLSKLENTHTKPQEFSEIGQAKSKQNFDFDRPLNNPEEWTMGETKLQVYDTV